MRLIDADALMEEMDKITWYSLSRNGRLIVGATSERESYLPTKKVWDAVSNAPIIGAEPVRHGQWNDSLDGVTPYCTACGMTHRLITRLPKYCPNCGAKMDGRDNHAGTTND